MTVLEAAHDYVRRGWGVVPLYGVADDICRCEAGPVCPSGGKHPHGTRGGWRILTGGPDVQAWFEDNPQDNLGIVTGPDSGIFVLDVDGPKGIASITDLANEHGGMPPTRLVRTGSGGLHYFFRHPGHFVVHNSTSYIAPGIDIRGKGGQVVAPPSASSRGPYELLADLDVAEGPDWLLEALREHTARVELGHRAEVRTAEHVDVELLPERVSHLIRQHVGMDEGRYKHFHAAVAAIYEAGYSQGQAVTLIAPWCAAVGKFVGRVEQEVARTWGKLEAEAARANEWVPGLGDRSQPAKPAYPQEQPWTSAQTAEAPTSPPAPTATASLPAVSTVITSGPSGSSPDPEVAPELPASWAPIDPGPILDGTFEPVLPQLFPRSDGHCLLYRGLVHSFHGESESGKSLIAQGEVGRVLEQAGGRAAYVDFESDASSVYGRLLDMGVSKQALRERFSYRRPDSNPFTAPHERAAFAELLHQPLDVVVIDGVTDALAVFGAGSNDMDEVTQVQRRFFRRVAERTGAAVIVIDHVAKDADTRGRHAVGSQAKLNGLDGAAYVIEVEEHLGQGLRGVVVMRVGKDRPGGVRPHSGKFRKTDRTQEAARVVVDSTQGGIRITVEAPELDTGEGVYSAADRARAQLSMVMEALSLHMQASPKPLSRTNVEAWANGRATKRDDALQAFEELKRLGHVVQAPSVARGGARPWVLERPYSAMDQWPENPVYTGTPPNPAEPRDGGVTNHPASHPHHVVGGGGVGSAESEENSAGFPAGFGGAVLRSCVGCFTPTPQAVYDLWAGRCGDCARKAGLV